MKKTNQINNTSFPLSLFQLLVSVFIYLMSLLDCESTPPLGGVCPRCSYGIIGTGSGFKTYFSLSLSLSLCPDFFFSLFREKYDGLSCLTTTARTPREMPHFGRNKSLCLGGTGADGAAGWRGQGAQQPVHWGEGPAAKEKSQASGWSLPRSGGWPKLDWMVWSSTTCPAAVTTVTPEVALTGQPSYLLPPYWGSRAAWTGRTRPPAVTLCPNVIS